MPNRYKDLHEYFRETGTKKTFIAQKLGISRFQMSALLYPDRYPIDITPDLERRIATLLGQPVEYVRKFYERAA
jgi:plasmid maintenance system antidote protein VapI